MTKRSSRADCWMLHLLWARVKKLKPQGSYYCVGLHKMSQSTSHKKQTSFQLGYGWIVSSQPPHVELLCHLFSLRLLWHLDTKSREYEGIVSVVCKYEICRSLRAIISENCCINVVKGEVGYLVWILPVQSFYNAALLHILFDLIFVQRTDHHRNNPLNDHQN